VDSGVALSKRQVQPASRSYFYLPRHFLLCPLPVRKPEFESNLWRRSNLLSEMEIRSDPRYGVPHGQDRLVLLWIATLAIQQNSPHVRVGSAYRLLSMFGLPQDGRNYQRLTERFNRLLHSHFTFQFRDRVKPLVMEPLTYSISSGWRLWFEHSHPDAEENSITLSPQFWKHLSAEAVPVPTYLVEGLADSPANLDFSLWLLAHAVRVRSGRFMKVPLSGPTGVGRHLGIEGYDQERDLRKRVRQWLSRAKQHWTECPAIISADGTHLLVCRVPLPTRFS
jgi:hypothetical protein